MKIHFSIERKILSFSTPAYALTLPATSGRAGCLNLGTLACQMKKNEGPIPVGKYFIKPQELSDPGLFGDLLRQSQGDWGDWRIVLHPESDTNTHGRDGFFIHGGGSSGSAGCIDVGGGLGGNNKTDMMLLAIKASSINIPVEVSL